MFKLQQKRRFKRHRGVVSHVKVAQIQLFYFSIINKRNLFLASNSGVSIRRFNVTVVAAGGGESVGTTTSDSVSPVPRHRQTQPFASIPEDHAVDDTNNTLQLQQQTISSGAASRSASPAPSWDFSIDESDSVSYCY